MKLCHLLVQYLRNVPYLTVPYLSEVQWIISEFNPDNTIILLNVTKSMIKHMEYLLAFVKLGSWI